MAEETEFAMGAKASCVDGPGGKVIRVIIDPATTTVTHLVIEPKHRVGAGRLVPLDLVDSAAGGIRLRCTVEEFGRLEAAEEMELVDDVQVDPDNHRVTHVLLGEGHLWGRKEVAIPVSAVTKVENGIWLNLTKKQVEDLPPVG